MKNINLSIAIFTSLCLLFSLNFVRAQAPQISLELENIEDNGSSVSFDIMVYASQGHVLNFAQGDINLSFDQTLFGDEVSLQMEEGVLKSEFASAAIVEDREGNKSAIINWNLHQDETDFPVNFTNGSIPQVNMEGTLLGRFTLNGKTATGDPQLSWNESATLPTEIWHYRDTDNHVELASATLGTGGSLPVELINFNAKRGSTGEVLLNWATANEQNSSHFEIEKQVPGDTFRRIGEVASAGNSTVTLSYDFVDRTVMAPTVYYRLRQVDLDGSFSYSRVVEVNFDNLTTQFAIYPNPVEDILNVEATQTEAGTVKFELSDLNGRVLRRGNWDTTTGNLQVEVTSQSTGIYHLTIENETGIRYTQKVLKK